MSIDLEALNLHAERQEIERRQQQDNERRQKANDALMAFVKPGRLASEIRANLRIVEELVNDCRDLVKTDDGWTMGKWSDGRAWPASVDASQIVLAEKLLRFTKQTVRYRAGGILVTFEWEAP